MQSILPIVGLNVPTGQSIYIISVVVSIVIVVVMLLPAQPVVGALPPLPAVH